MWVLHNEARRRGNEEETRTRRGEKKRHKTGQLAKSVRHGINNPFPKMPSIVPCLDKAAKSGWKMRVPFLSMEI